MSRTPTMFVGPLPPLPSVYRNFPPVPPPRFEEEMSAAAGSMSAPIVIALLLSVFLFALCLIFFFSPACRHQERAPKPVDVEDAYFTDENPRRGRPSFAKAPTYEATTMEHPFKKLYHLKDTYFSFVQPPPAYTSRPGSPAGSFDDWSRSFGSLLGLKTSKPQEAPITTRSTKSRLFDLSLPSIFSRKRRITPSMIPISKPIPQPEIPLPGPDVLPEPDTHQPASDTTFIRPCIGKSVSEHILHPSTSELHMPSQAHVYNRDTFTLAQQNTHYLTAAHSQRSSTRLGLARTQSQGSISSITSSMIGIAL